MVMLNTFRSVQDLVELIMHFRGHFCYPNIP